MSVRPRSVLVSLLTGAVALAGAADARAAFPGGNGLLGYSATANGRLYMRDSHGALHRVKTPGRPRDPAFSPQGLRVAYDTADGRLWTSYLDGKPLLLATGVTPSRDPAWSPGGDRIAFAGGSFGRRDLFTVGAYGRGRASSPSTRPTTTRRRGPRSTSSPSCARPAHARRHHDHARLRRRSAAADARERGRRVPGVVARGRRIAFARAARRGRQLYVMARTPAPSAGSRD